MNGFFGVRWNAPAFEDAPELPTPVGARCLLCPDLIEAGESGVVIPCDTEDGPVAAPQHIECFLRSIAGSVTHLEHRCRCFGGSDDHESRNYRADARETMAWLVQHT